MKTRVPRVAGEHVNNVLLSPPRFGWSESKNERERRKNATGYFARARGLSRKWMEMIRGEMLPKRKGIIFLQKSYDISDKSLRLLNNYTEEQASLPPEISTYSNKIASLVIQFQFKNLSKSLFSLDNHTSLFNRRPKSSPSTFPKVSRISRRITV